MIWPHTVTVYNYTAQGYQRTVLHGVLWSDTKAKNVNNTGSSVVDSVKITIPFSVDAGDVAYKSPDDYQSDPAGAWSMQTDVKDFAVKGECPFDPAGKQISELVKNYEAFTITSVKTCDYGSVAMQHWAVGAK